MAKLTLLGLENWLQPAKSLFNDLTFPDSIDKETAVGVILQECGEFETLYPDPDYLAGSIKLWGLKHYFTFQKWAEALEAEYNPIENYDRYEEWTDTGSGTQKADIKTSGTNNGSTQTDTRVSTYESSTLHIRDRVNGTSRDTTATQSGSTQQTDGTSHHVGHVHGNIGVTTGQQMVQSSLDLYKWNLYQHIADLFKIEFCVMTY